MKLNLGCGVDLRPSYINVDCIPIPNAPQDLFRHGDVGSLEWLCKSNEADEILALDVLDFFPYRVVDDILANWVDKLRSGGTLKISVVNIRSICNDLANCQMNIVNCIQLLYGQQNHMADFRKSVTDILTIREKLQSLNLTITCERLEGHFIYIEATKQ